MAKLSHPSPYISGKRDKNKTPHCSHGPSGQYKQIMCRQKADGDLNVHISQNQIRNDTSLQPSAASLFFVRDMKLWCVSCFGWWLQAGTWASCVSLVSEMCEWGRSVLPASLSARVHAIADVGTVHLFTGMALMCYNEIHRSLYWKKWAKRHRPLRQHAAGAAVLMEENVFTLHYCMRKLQCLMWDWWGTLISLEQTELRMKEGCD